MTVPNGNVGYCLFIISRIAGVLVMFSCKSGTVAFRIIYLHHSQWYLRTFKSLERTKIRSRVRRGPNNNIDCAGEDQQQFSGLDWTLTAVNHCSSYVLASCCTVLFNGCCRLCLRLRAALSTEQTENKQNKQRINNKEQADKRTSKKKNEGKQRKKHKWKLAECDHVKKRQKKAVKQNPSSI
jgi:hypothetical protein